MAENTSLVDQARDYANRIDPFTRRFLDNLTCKFVADLLRQLADRVQEMEGKGEPVMIYHGRHTIDCGEFGSHDMEMLKLIPAGTKLYTSPPSSVQPEKERRPITEQQILAAATCHERGRVVISTVQRTLRIGYREADELCRSIIAAGLVDGLEISPALLPVSPSPSMVGREGE